MTNVIVDAQMRSKLFNLSQPLDLCDERGQVLGSYFPRAALPPPDYQEAPLSEDEWRRREQEREFTTAEVLARLEKL